MTKGQTAATLLTLAIVAAVIILAAHSFHLNEAHMPGANIPSTHPTKNKQPDYQYDDPCALDPHLEGCAKG